MIHFQPTFATKETAQNVRYFIQANMSVFWDIFKPLIPYIVVLNLMDSIVTGLYFIDSKNEFRLGEFLSIYFTVVLTISWHRVVILGQDHFIPMKPFKPKKNELIFIGVGFLIGVIGILFSMSFVIFGAIARQPGIVFLAIPALLVALYVIYKLSFYFPAKAVDSSLTLRQSFSLTKGYLLKMIFSSVWASWRLILLAFVYGLVLGAIAEGMLHFSGKSLGLYLMVFVLNLPIRLYFEPILTIIGVTILSNYYQHALQNKLETVDG